MIDIFVQMNSNLQAIEYKKIKKIKKIQFAQSSIKHKSSKKFKKLAQLLKEQFNFADIIK